MNTTTIQEVLFDLYDAEKSGLLKFNPDAERPQEFANAREWVREQIEKLESVECDLSHSENQNAIMHTPRPWKYGISPSGRQVIFAEFTEGTTDIAALIGMEECGEEDWTPVHWAEAEANKNLLCSAPDLLEALETLASRMSENADGRELYGDWIAIAEEAIAKAKGEAK
jgi:glutamate synthase domain-containing protein 1